MSFLLAACSMLYELLLAQALSSLLANTVIWYSLTVGCFLGSMGLGALYCDEFCRRRTPGEALVDTEVHLCVLGAIAVPLVKTFDLLALSIDQSFQPGLGLAIMVVLYFTVTSGIGFLTGLELPLLMKLARGEGGPAGTFNRVLAADYLGALAGALAFPLMLLPRWELMEIGLMTAGVNLLAAVWLRRRVRRGNGKQDRLPWRMALIAAGFVVFGCSLPVVEDYFLHHIYVLKNRPGFVFQPFSGLKDFLRVKRIKTPYQRIDLVKYVQPPSELQAALQDAYGSRPGPDGDAPGRNFELYLNYELQFVGEFEKLYHEYMAHIPVILNGRIPKHVLVLGGGDGLLVRELLKYDEVESIELIELDAEMLNLARNHPEFRALNKRSLDDPRVTVRTGDAYQAVRTGRGRYGAIYMDFPFAADYALSKLYSREFYTFVRRRLKEDGFIVYDACGTTGALVQDSAGVLHPARGNDWQVHDQTLRAAGFQTIVPFVTNLEDDNPQAVAAMDRFAEQILDEWRQQKRPFPRGWNAEARESWKEALIKRGMADFLRRLRSGFIAAWPGSKELNRVYRPLVGDLDVLNETRFERAFWVDFKPPAEPRGRDVNSIMRPTLPRSWLRTVPAQGY